MFSLQTCSVAGCGHWAVHRKRTCFSHIADPARYEQELRQLIAQTDTLADMNLSFIELSELDLSGKNINRCILSHAGIQRVNLNNTRIRLLFVDFARISNCSFLASNIHNAVFAGSEIEACDFSGSDILHCNFCGVRCRETLFNESDLYASRFIASSKLWLSIPFLNFLN